MNKSKAKPKIHFDYPKNDEAITGPAYAARIEAEVPGTVEVSIDEGPWKPCRQAAGYWWYDLDCSKPGKHKAVARIRDGNRPITTGPRRFKTKGTRRAA